MSSQPVVDFEGKQLSQDDINDRIDELRQLILADEDYKLLRTDDAFLLRFLHRLNFNVQKAFKGIRYYYNFIIEQHDWLPMDPPEAFKDMLDMNMRFILPFNDKSGKRICYFKTDTVDPSKVSITDMSKLESILMESILDEPEVQSSGLCLLIDASGVSFKMLSWITPDNIQKSIRRLDHLIMKDGVFHVVRTSMLLNVAMKIVMPMLPERIKDRVKFHYNDFDSLHEYISPECLPKEFGGHADLDYEKLNEDILSKSDMIEQKIQHIRDIVKAKV